MQASEKVETDFSSDLRKEWAPLKLDPSFLWLPGKSQAYSETCLPIHYSMKLGKLFSQVWTSDHCTCYGKFHEKRWHLIHRRSSSYCQSVRSHDPLIGLCIHPDSSGQLNFLSVLQGCRNGERKLKGHVAHVLCVLVTYPSQL